MVQHRAQADKKKEYFPPIYRHSGYIIMHPAAEVKINIYETPVMLKVLFNKIHGIFMHELVDDLIGVDTVK
jgi:hypothetical protein